MDLPNYLENGGYFLRVLIVFCLVGMQSSVEVGLGQIQNAISIFILMGGLLHEVEAPRLQDLGSQQLRLGTFALLFAGDVEDLLEYLVGRGERSILSLYLGFEEASLTPFECLLAHVSKLLMSYLPTELEAAAARVFAFRYSFFSAWSLDSPCRLLESSSSGSDS